MPVVIALLRGVNLGGRNLIKMDVLRELCAALNCVDIKTYLQSGNVIFRTRKRISPGLASEIEQAIEKELGFRPAVVLRSVEDMRGVVARNPFAGRKDVAPNKLLVSFLAAEPTREAREKIRSLKAEPEEWMLIGREMYIYYPNGMARPKLPLATMERALAVSGTGRNWNTVTKLLAMGEEMER